MPDSAYQSAVADLVAANRILSAQGVLDGFGHVSVRCAGDPNFYFMSRSVAPALVSAEDVMIHDIENRAVREADRQKKLYYERWIHGEVYKARPDVGAIVHSHSPTVVPFASTRAPLRPLLHNASFLGFGAPVFEIRKHVAGSDLMISTAELARAMASTLGHEAQVVCCVGMATWSSGPPFRSRFSAPTTPRSTQGSSFRPSCWGVTTSSTWTKANVEPPTRS